MIAHSLAILACPQLLINLSTTLLVYIIKTSSHKSGVSLALSTKNAAYIALFRVTSLILYVFCPPFYPQAVDNGVDKPGERLIGLTLENAQSDNIRADNQLSTVFVDYLWVNHQLIHKSLGDCGRIYVRLVENCLTISLRGY